MTGQVCGLSTQQGTNPVWCGCRWGCILAQPWTVRVRRRCGLVKLLWPLVIVLCCIVLYHITLHFYFILWWDG